MCHSAAKAAATQPVLATQEMETQIHMDASLMNRQAWRAAQAQSHACKVAVSHLKSGKVPTSKPGDLNNKIRHYVRHGSLAPDGLLVTVGKQST